MSDRRALHERIWESLGWQFGDRDDIAPEYRDAWCNQCWWSPAPNRAPYSWNEMPNFDTHESANAMLLDAMPFVTLTKDDVSPYWAVVVDDPHGPLAYNDDRKRAIVDAYCAWKGIEQEVDR